MHCIDDCGHWGAPAGVRSFVDHNILSASAPLAAAFLRAL